MTSEGDRIVPPRRKSAIIGRLLYWLVLIPPTVWAMAALYVDVPASSWRAPLAAIYLAVAVFSWFRLRNRWLNLGVTLAGFSLVLSWWLSLKPSQTREWQPDVVVLPYAEIVGEKVTVHNIRHCLYRSEFDYQVGHYDRTVDLRELRSVDLYMVYWGSPYMAHTMVSFGFNGGDYLCFSIETRKETAEAYSAVKGLFRQFELVYVVADERDLVKLRTDHRQGEEVYLFRLQMSQGKARELFLDYVRRINNLHERPEWYSAVTQNCTTSIRTQRAADARAPWDWRMLVNGYGDQLLYERGMIVTNLPLADLKRLAHINARARAAGEARDFSRRIRQGVPGIGL